MPTLRERFARLVAAPELQQMDQLREMQDRMWDAYMQGPYMLTPDELLRQLREYYDPRLVQDMLDRMNWETISGYGGYSSDERTRAVNDSKRMWKYSLLAAWIVNLWTYYGLGEDVSIIAEDEQADQIWQEFWAADRNRKLLGKSKLDELSRWFLVTGERFFAFYSSIQDGETTIRALPPDQITNVVTNPEDDAEYWFYERTYTNSDGTTRTLYYPDWELFFAGSEKVAQAWSAYRNSKQYTQGELVENEQTDVCVLFVPFRQLDEDSPRGWPLLAPQGTPWLRAQRKFMEDRATVARGVASYIRRYQTKGGSRAVDSIASALMSSFQTGGTQERNPPPTAGSSEVINQAVTVEDLPLKTGASDAKSDGEMFAWMAGLSGGVFPHYLGLGDAYRLATATAMERPLEMQFSLYRAQLSAMFRDIVRIVLQFKELHSNATYSTYNADISTDKLVESDLALTSESLAKVYKDVVAPILAERGLDREAIVSIATFFVQQALQALGAVDVQDMINADMWEEPEEPAPAPPAPPQAPTEEEEEEAVEELWREYAAALERHANAGDNGDSTMSEEAIQPRGKPLKPWGDKPVPITPEDVARAIKNWEKRMPEDARGILTAREATPEEQEQSQRTEAPTAEPEGLPLPDVEV